MLVYRARRGGAPLDEAEVESICSQMATIEATLSRGATGPGPGPDAGPGDPPTSGPPAGPPRGYSLDDV